MSALGEIKSSYTSDPVNYVPRKESSPKWSFRQREIDENHNDHSTREEFAEDVRRRESNMRRNKPILHTIL